jgi:CheY-like chemotaxis protein
MPHLALVVEDESSLRLIYEVVLTSLGFHVVHASDGHQALEILKANTPAVVFLDMLLPKVNGLTVLDYLHSASHLQHTHIVVVTAHHRFGQSEMLRPQDEFLLKPVQPQDIRKAALHANTPNANC